jgi:hypothetical protein
MREFPKEKSIKKMFENACNELGIEESKRNVEELVIYEMTDGSRTSTGSESGWKAYFEGGIFCLRFIHFLKILGGKYLYVNVIHERHKFRENYRDIYEGMRQLVDIYRDYAEYNQDVRWRFIGDYKHRIEPSGMNSFDLRKALKSLENINTGNTKAFTVYFMINYSTKWLAKEGWKLFEPLPDIDVILRHCKGYVNGDMWLYDKLDNNSFMYVQNGSVSKNWSDQQLVYLISMALRSKILNQGTHYSKTYTEKEIDEIRRKREIELSIVHRKLEEKPSKRVIIFSSVGPEIYEF